MSDNSDKKDLLKTADFGDGEGDKETKLNRTNTTGDENTKETEESFTWSEIMEMKKEEEKAAEALLGGQNDMVCSYPEAYKYRQPLYSCRTCALETGQQAGVCYACTIHCHEGHDLIELYTKRRFCCDCGNSKFKQKCKLWAEKDKTNPRNKYSHNFDQLYCTCNKVYPPEEGETNPDGLHSTADMHQCCICEDWFHLEHIMEEPDEKEMLASLLQNGLEDACDLICKDCATSLPFLMLYKRFAIPMSKKEEKALEVVGTAHGSVENQINGESVSATTSFDCKMKELKSMGEDQTKPHAMYFDGTTLREKLCVCRECMRLYEDNDCTFLLDEEDTMKFYDEKRRENMALKGEVSVNHDESDLDLAGKVYQLVAEETKNPDAALLAYKAVDDMSKHVTTYFQNLGHRDVTKEDIEKCFEELNAKRPRLDLDDDDHPWTG